HSFMPPIRVFGRIEKKYRSKEKIISPQQYHDILQEHGTLKLLGSDWNSLVNVVKESNHISEKKKKDVQELLKFVQLSEEDQQYYGKALQDVVSDVAVQDHSEVVYDEQEPFL
ncbi:hypothetical protein J6590_107782, partial [Homalodisca vitripennis]